MVVVYMTCGSVACQLFFRELHLYYCSLYMSCLVVLSVEHFFSDLVSSSTDRARINGGQGMNINMDSTEGHF